MVIPTEDVICFAAGDIEWIGHGTSQAPYPTEMLDLLRVGVICIGMIRVVEGADPYNKVHLLRLQTYNLGTFVNWIIFLIWKIMGLKTHIEHEIYSFIKEC